MMKQGRFILLLIASTSLAGCLGSVWTGATMVYDRHNVYKKISDYHLMMQVTNALYADKKLKAQGCLLDLAVFNGDVLIAGHVPSSEQLEDIKQRLQPIHDYRRLFNEITISNTPSNNVDDGWITTKIRSKIFADGSIDPNTFKVVTSDRVVYLMGDVKPEEAEKVILIARQESNVVRVVKLMKYFTYQSK